MEQYIEFIGNHYIMVGGFVILLGFILYTEVDRLTSGVKSIGINEALRMQNDETVVFIDVREEKEFKTGHIIDAHNIPSAMMEKRAQELKVEKETPIVVYCDTGGLRANSGAKAMRKLGYTKVLNLEGGLAGWSKANLPLVTR